MHSSEVVPLILISEYQASFVNVEPVHFFRGPDDSIITTTGQRKNANNAINIKFRTASTTSEKPDFSPGCFTSMSAVFGRYL